jgi:DNA-binding response OmpR family regulator
MIETDGRAQFPSARPSAAAASHRWHSDMHILIAETDLAFLAEMKLALEAAGYEITVASDGMGAWGYLAGTAPPDLLITRLHLDPGSPPGTAPGMHAQSRNPRIPVIYIPADRERAGLVDSDHGAVLIKPFPLEDLMATIHRLLGSEP